MNTKNTILITLGVVVVGVIIFFATQRGATAPAVNPLQRSETSSTQTTASVPVVAIENYAFSPSTLTVKKGTTVTWTNNDSAPHTIVSRQQEVALKSETLSNGQVYAYTFETVGSFVYYCGVHPSMRGTIIVTE